MAASKQRKASLYAISLVLIMLEIQNVGGVDQFERSTTVKDNRDSATVITEFSSDATNCQLTQTIFNNGFKFNCANKLIFNDDFDGQSLDVRKWKLERHFGSEPDYEFNMYLDDVPEVLDIKEGVVKLKPKATLSHFSDFGIHLRHDLNLGANCTGRSETLECDFQTKLTNGIVNPLITAQFSTKNLFSFKYGRVEIRAQLPNADWAFPQLWLQPVTNAYGDNNYESGQLRIAFSQSNDNEMQLFGGVILNAAKPWRLEKMCRKTQTNESKQTNWGDDFHIYTVIWTEKDISFLVDNVEYCRISTSDKALADSFEKNLPNHDLLKKGTPLAPFDQEFYLTIGYGIGGHYDFYDNDESAWKKPKIWRNRSPKAESKFWNYMENHVDQWLATADMKIDYVKVFSL